MGGASLGKSLSEKFVMFRMSMGAAREGLKKEKANGTITEANSAFICHCRGSEALVALIAVLLFPR